MQYPNECTRTAIERIRNVRSHSQCNREWMVWGFELRRRKKYVGAMFTRAMRSIIYAPAANTHSIVCRMGNCECVRMASSLAFSLRSMKRLLRLTPNVRNSFVARMPIASFRFSIVLATQDAAKYKKMRKDVRAQRAVDNVSAPSDIRRIYLCTVEHSGFGSINNNK